MTVEHWIDLNCHPSTSPEAARAIGVLVRRSANAELQMNFPLDGDIRRIRVPRRACRALPRSSGATPASRRSSLSIGINFAPSGEWAVRRVIDSAA